MVFGDTAGGRPEFGNRAGVERFAPLRTRGWCESLHPPGLSGAKYLTPLGGVTEFPLRREAWDAARRGLGLAWFARGLTAGRLSLVQAQRREAWGATRRRLGLAWFARGLTAGRLSLVQAQRREAWGAAKRRLGPAWFARGLTAARLSLVQAQRREAWDAARRRLGQGWFARGLTAGRLSLVGGSPSDLPGLLGPRAGRLTSTRARSQTCCGPASPRPSAWIACCISPESWAAASLEPHLSSHWRPPLLGASPSA